MLYIMFLDQVGDDGATFSSLEKIQLEIVRVRSASGKALGLHLPRLTRAGKIDKRHAHQ